MEGSEDVPISDFLHMIEWKSPFVITLLSVQLMWFVLTVISCWTRKLRMILVSVAAAGAFLAEKFNILLSDNWYRLGLKRNIFDHEGFFMFVFWAVPLAFDIFILVLSYLRELCEAMTMSLKIRAAIKARKENGKKTQ